jgi:NADH-quinone oxidoreductase subunit H
MAGWASANKFSLIGALRAAAQLIAYELPMILAAVAVVMQAGTLSLVGITEAQQPFWYVLTQPVMFVIFLVASLAELTRTPFDMPIAESEIVGGYLVEYTGLRFLLFFIGEFATAGVFAAIASVLFLGGWYLPGIDSTSNAFNVIGPLILFAKMMIVAFLIIWARFTFPRFREDQLQRLAWKFLIPIALVNIAVTAVLKVVF